MSEEYPLLILLVGSNPLPNFLSACALRPRRVALLHTPETADAKERLKSQLKSALDDEITFVEPDPCVQDAFCARTVRRALDPLLRRRDDSEKAEPVWLNYTGGTKVMAAHARMAFSQCGGKQEQASYLDEGGEGREPRLRFDDGNSKPLSDLPAVGVTVETILALHGRRPEERKATNPAPSHEDAGSILCKVLQDLPLAAALYCEYQRLKQESPNNAVAAPFRSDRYRLDLSLDVFPTHAQLNGFGKSQERKSWYRQWYDFIGGQWLEMWVGKQIEDMKLEPRRKVAVGVKAYRGEKKYQMEIDLAVVGRYRTHFISCTTDTTKGLCKSKLFEVAVRSRQLGGDLARAALVCLADNRIANELQADIDDVWGATNTTRAFGLSDVRAWAQCGDTAANRSSLKTWLES